ncbi:polysaccharide biosynthesis protein [Weissella coleopterorum]|uniref:Polysaccharide biosynthesis protein n=1 Tax=Weissella coleopterorum TaxID=2714949 RepID=A0A6G8AYZ8_9LACO|nr:polysaccharide biosynthesis protein [Weissella coleopterorum]QIL50182.1 polysaccharide biosynthesis protein [Weissella coleopterorum]
MTAETQNDKKIRREMTYQEVQNLLHQQQQRTEAVDTNASKKTPGEVSKRALNRSGKLVRGSQKVYIKPSHRKKISFPENEVMNGATTSQHAIQVTEVADSYHYEKLEPIKSNTSSLKGQPQIKPLKTQPATKPSASKASNVVSEPSESLSDQSKMLRGSLWMTIGNLVSRLLGALYIIPWSMMIGVAYTTSANGLYAQGYQIYSVALLVATAGLPNVLARLVAEFAEKKQFGRVKSVLRQSLILGLVMGAVAALILYILAEPLSQGNEHVVPVLYSLAPAVLVIPVLSMLRGYVQGFELMGISALSQVVEQVVRVLYMLGMTAWIMLGHHGSWVDATVQSTFAAFWGALAGILVVLIGIFLRRGYFASKFVVHSRESNVPAGNLIGKMMWQAIPVVFAGSAISLVQLMDQFSFFRLMHDFTSVNQTDLNQMFAQFSFNSNKLVMLVVSLAIAMSETALPMLARAHAKNDAVATGQQINYILKLLAFVMVPASLGVVAVAKPLYILFYGAADVQNGVLILQFSGYIGLLFGVYMVILAINQGLGQLRFTVWWTFLILILKMVLQYPAIYFFQGMGPLIATGMAFLIGLIWALIKLLKQYPINWAKFNYSLMTILFWSLIMFAVVTPVVIWMETFVAETRLQQSMVLGVGVGVGIFIYGAVTLKSHLGQNIFGMRAQMIAHKLHLK